ncbi:hypothetical protein [Rhizobium leguminosarum]|uniref:hypothetical protein n=1 Tax=Rhizobium leguminosarum TaxID=384 RepID=UPI001C91858B|nr:hypothetical protein [Rhizobium leguminosarum]MBY2910184.1 hypothetical protein [Rhizobium leguminosarum]
MLQCTVLLWAIVLGYLFFNDIPDARIIICAAIISVAGLFILHRENLKQTIPATGGWAP